jgi:hypothetical protein
MRTQLNFPTLQITELNILFTLFTAKSTLHSSLQQRGTRYFYYCNWNVERRGLRPSPDLPCPCGAATHTALWAPRQSCHWFLVCPPSSQQAVCQYAFSMAATASDPNRPSSQGVATVRYNQSPAIGCSIRNVTNPFQRNYARLFNIASYKFI